jgi:hypothetical protein
LEVGPTILPFKQHYIFQPNSSSITGNLTSVKSLITANYLPGSQAGKAAIID